MDASKNNGFDSNDVLDLRDRKDGFWTNGGIEFTKKNDGFDSNDVLDLREKQKKETKKKRGKNEKRKNKKTKNWKKTMNEMGQKNDKIGSVYHWIIKF